MMELFRKNRLLELPDNAIQDMRKMYNLDKPGNMDEAVNILEDWIKKQNHILKKDFDRGYLEKGIILAKGSIEKAKKHIDRLCTFKTLLPEYFSETKVKPELEHIFELAWLVPLPKVTEDFYRVFIIKCHEKMNKPVKEKYYLQYFQYSMILAEYIRAHDYINGFIAVYDLQNINLMDTILKVNPVQLQQYVSILIEGFGGRLKQIFLLTQSKAIDLLVKMIKPILSQKISDRLIVCKTLEELYSMLPKDLLPEDYGGKEKPMSDMIAYWIEELSTKEHVEYMKMMRKACTNEKLRLPDSFNEDYMGTPGSFRNLIVD